MIIILIEFLIGILIIHIYWDCDDFDWIVLLWYWLW